MLAILAAANPAWAGQQPLGATPVPVALPAIPGSQGAVSRALTAILPDGALRALSVDDLEGLGTHGVRTTTFWPADDGAYQGPLLRDVIKAVGLDGVRAVRVNAIDGFSQIIPAEDWNRWPILLATRRDGHPMSLADKGPLRIIYPRDMDAALADQVYRLRWVWMVQSLEAVTP